MRNLLLPIVAAGLTMMFAGNVAAKEASGSVTMTAVVPEVCNLSAIQFTLTQDGSLTGNVQEFCNTSTVFSILASYRALGTSERASVRYGADTSKLNSTGLSTVASRSGQRLAYTPVKIEAQNLTQPLAIAFSIAAV